MSIVDIRTHFQCQNKISNVKIRYSDAVRISTDFGCQNSMFGLSPNVNIVFRMSKI